MIAITKKVSIKEIASSIENNNEAIETIFAIDEHIACWNFTLSVIEKFLKLLNEYETEVRELEEITPEFIRQLTQAYKNFIGETE